MSHEHHCHCENQKVHCCLKVAKLALKVATVAATFCIAKELHKVHKAIEAKK